MKRKRFNPIFCLLMLVFLIPLIPTGLAYWGIIDTQTFTPNTNTNGLVYVDNENNKFPTVESALKYAENDLGSNNIYLIPGSSGKPNEFSIKEDVIIAGGDSLILPYSGTNYKNGESGWASGASDFSKRATHCVTTLKVDSDKTITVFGNLCVGGITGNTGQSTISHTTGLFTEIILGTNTSIEVKGSNSKVEVFGYIRRSQADYLNGIYDKSMLIMSAGSLYAPGVFYDFKGGTISSNQNSNSIFPFNIFDFPNLELKVKIKNGSSFVAIIKFSVSVPVLGDLNQVKEMNFVGSNLLFDTSTANSSLSFTYIPSSYGNPTNKYFNDTTYTLYEIEGSVGLRKASLNLMLLTVDTANFFLPISYKMKVKVKKDAEFTAYNDIKIMPGSEIIIEEGGKIIVSNGAEILAHDAIHYDLGGAAEDAFAYPFNRFDSGAYIENNGSIVVNEGGYVYGLVHAGSDKGSIRFTSTPSASGNVKEYKNASTNLEIPKTLPRGYFASNGEISDFTTSGFYSSSYIEEFNKYCWSISDSEITISNLAVNPTKVPASGGSIEVLSTINIKPVGSSAIVSLELDENQIKELTLTDSDNDGIISYQDNLDFSSNNETAEKKHKITVRALHSANPSSNDFETIEINQLSKYAIELTSFTAEDDEIPNGENPVFNYKITISPQGIYNKEDIKLYINDISFNIENNTNTSGVVTGRITYPNSITEDETEFTAYATYGKLLSNKIKVTIKKEDSGGGGSSCVLPNTLITLADGTKKYAKDIMSGDLVMVMNHETGEWDFSPVIVNDYEGSNYYKVTHLKFSNGEMVSYSYEHGFFDMTENKYVYFNNNNAEDYIGHRFYSVKGPTTLIEIETEIMYTELYSPVTAMHFNVVTNDMLSMPGGINGLFNIFDYEKDSLKYDEQLKQEDINKYGLYTYDDFKDYTSFEFYNAVPAPYFKVAVGKGLITFEGIIDLIKKYEGKVTV